MGRRRSIGLVGAVGLLAAACTASAGPMDVDASSDAARADSAMPDDGGPSDGDAIDAAGDAGPPPLRVLFVGNSYTRFDDLPSVVAAVTGTPSLQVEPVLVDGATLWDHWTTTGARARVESGDFDVVVLQGQSSEPILDARGDSTGFSFAAQNFITAATEHGERVLFFVTWARRAGHPDYATLRLGDPATMTRDLEAGYWSGAGWLADDAAYAHVGLAWQIAIAELPEVDLYAADGSHPSPAGSLLAACVLSQMIGTDYARIPAEVPLGLDRSVAESLCAIAPRVACTSGTYCHGACVQTQSDPLHCGACDAACAGDLPCVAGTCACPFPGQSPCPGRFCTDLASDAGHCGTCGHACEPGQACASGACACTGTARIDAPSGALTALRAGCTRDSPTLDDDCAAAAAAYCGALGCFDTGVTETPFPPMAPGVICFSGAPLARSYAALSALVPACDGASAAYGAACETAIHRACVASGAVSGAIASADATGVTATCVHDATVVRTTFTALSGTLSFCDGTTTRSGVACTAASAWTCQAMGHAGGFGPVEAAGDDVDVVCLD